MPSFEFAIVACGLDPTVEDFFDRFYEAGCDDATVAWQKGHIVLDFARAAPSLAEAIASAVADVKKAGAKVERIEPDPLVSLADMAARAGLTRAAMTHYSKGARGKDFPPPVAKVTSESPLWDWATVARWMFENRKLDRAAAVEAEIVREANEIVRNGAADIGRRLKKTAKDYAKELEVA
jgi:hypothetical protein